jgi:hypothetical protein
MAGFLSFSILAVLLKLLLIAQFDFPSFGGGHDDYWFVLRSLDWYWFSQSYDQMSHIKEPLWTLIMAVLRQTGIPLRLLLELGYGLTAFLVSLLIIPRGIKFSQVSRSVCFLLIILAPISIPVFERTTSDPIFGMIFALTLATFVRGCRTTGMRELFRLGALSAFLLGLLSITRGEGFLSTISGIGAFLGVVICRADVYGSWRNRLATAAFLCTLMLSIAYAVKLPILLGNYITFGNWTVSDQSEPSYVRAMKALVSVRPRNPVPHAPLARATIERIAAVSPAMREISPALLGDLGTGWARASLGHPTPEGEIGAGWLGWAVRDSAAAAGKYATPATARAFYNDLATQIEGAFETKHLPRRTVIHPLAISFPSISEFTGALRDVLKASILPRAFRPVQEWTNPQVQFHYDVATNRKSIFLEKILSKEHPIESVGGLPELIVRKYELFQKLWLATLLLVTAYAFFIIRNATRSALVPILFGFLLILGTRLGMMSLIHSYAFHMTDWRYVFPVSLGICLLPLSLLGIAEKRNTASVAKRT